MFQRRPSPAGSRGRGCVRRVAISFVLVGNGCLRPTDGESQSPKGIARISNSTARVSTISAAIWQQLQESSSSAPARRLATVLMPNFTAVGQPLSTRSREEDVQGASEEGIALQRSSYTKARFAEVILGRQRPLRAVMCSWHHGIRFIQRRIFEFSAASRAVGDPTGVVPGVVGGGLKLSTT
jgi:hypothetical protein